MSPHDPSDKDNGTQEDSRIWIEELGDPDLVQFAHDFDSARPELPQSSLDRMQQLVQSELRASRSLERPRWHSVLASACVAVVLLAVGFVLGRIYVRRTDVPTRRSIQPSPIAQRQVRVNDKFVMSYSPAERESNDENPLVPIERYLSLVGETK